MIEDRLREVIEAGVRAVVGDIVEGGFRVLERTRRPLESH